MEADEIEWFYDTEEHITPEENGGCATIEVYEREGKYKGTLIADNAVSKDLSAKEEGRKLIGYQIMDDDCEFPEDLFSFMVFKKEDDAYAYIQAKGLQGFKVLEQYEGDVEDPTFIGVRIFKEGERVFNCESNPRESDLRGWATVCQDFVEIYADQVVLIKMNDGSENETESANLYKIAEGKFCPRCGSPLCIEHNEEIDYPYFCPDCDENFYGIEVQ